MRCLGEVSLSRVTTSDYGVYPFSQEDCIVDSLEPRVEWFR